jgi:hypothetical protein
MVEFKVWFMTSDDAVVQDSVNGFVAAKATIVTRWFGEWRDGLYGLLQDNVSASPSSDQSRLVQGKTFTATDEIDQAIARIRRCVSYAKTF